MIFKKIEICEIYDGCEHYQLNEKICIGREICKIIKIKKCFLQEKVKLYFEDGKIKVKVMGRFSEITYRPKVKANEIHIETN